MNKQIDITKALKLAAERHDKQQAKWNGTSPFRPAIKFYSKLNVFKASNVSFDPTTLEAHSYRWWLFVKVIGDRVIFNDYSYSPSTGQHQNKVLSLLSQLGIKIDAYVESPSGLQELSSAITHYQYQIKQLKDAIANPRSRNGKNEQRAKEILSLEGKISLVHDLIKAETYFERQAA